ncbi:helix-turn-helix transcriptional regulator [Halomontanus rarus]|uniref:helix-turn-helix transcriptional regulator n=1 Tax=Halomontanus rarus TaxID=3034020 RepID=UPI00293BCA3F|nr:helix-turn-helix transcriptional regulator [Halovivax sp. KZCA124]
MYDLIIFQRDLLYAITGHDDPDGVAIKDVLEEVYKSEVNPRRLYTNLDTLVDKGLAEKREKDGRTNIYSLTERGKRKIKARREWEDQYVSEMLER